MRVRTFLIALAVVASTPASAQTNSQAELLDGCSLVGDLAGHVMGARQRRMPLKEALDAGYALVDQHGPSMSPVIGMTLDAYKRPVGATELERDQAVGDFADDAMLDCMNTLN